MPDDLWDFLSAFLVWLTLAVLCGVLMGVLGILLIRSL